MLILRGPGGFTGADTLENLRGRLEAWMVQTKDSLLEGDVPAPERAELNDPDGLSPTIPR